MSQGFDAPREGSGTHEWAEHNVNIQRGCACACLYCYAAHNAKRFKTVARADWHAEQLTANAQMTRYPLRQGVVMYPSAHDITPFNLEASVRVLTLILATGNRVLVVSKPRIACIERLAQALAPYRDQVMFRFTIGTTDEASAAFWEPGAPGPSERLDALQLAYDAGYRTSVSAEPLLGGPETAYAVLSLVRPFVTDTVWFGKMNRIRNRVDMTHADNAAAVAAIINAQHDAKMLEIYDHLRDDPMVRWKDSIIDVVQAHRPTTNSCASTRPAAAQVIIPGGGNV